MAFPEIQVRQPRAHDLVDAPVRVCGIATGFEGVIEARVRDANGNELKKIVINAGGTGIWGNFTAIIRTGVPPTPQGTLEVFETSAEDGSEINKVVRPIVFGRALRNPYHGFAVHTVVSGDTLSGIADQFYGDPSKFTLIFDANRHQISDPNLIFPGQDLRVPQ
jgi:nucleoid-associated protein YgaU